MSENVPETKKLGERGFYEPYAAFSRTLRTWLVAYGIGAPVLFASQDAFKPILRDSCIATCIIGFFFFGVIVQIIATLIYKYSMGYIYFGELDEAFQKTQRHKVAEWFSDAMWLEMVFDILSVVSFACATVIVMIQYIRIGPA